MINKTSILVKVITWCLGFCSLSANSQSQLNYRWNLLSYYHVFDQKYVIIKDTFPPECLPFFQLNFAENGSMTSIFLRHWITEGKYRVRKNGKIKIRSKIRMKAYDLDTTCPVNSSIRFHIGSLLHTAYQYEILGDKLKLFSRIKGAENKVEMILVKDCNQKTH